MSKKILIVETSNTIKKLFTTTLDPADYNLEFVSDCKEAIFKIFTFTPDVILVNAEIENPGSFEFVRLLREMNSLENLPVGMYASSHFPFDTLFAKTSGANSYVYLDEKTIILNVEELAQTNTNIPINKAAFAILKKSVDESSLFLTSTKVWKQDRFKNAILSTLFEMVKDLENMETVTKNYLTLISTLCEVPLVSLYVRENDAYRSYYISAEEVTNEEKDDFFKVCGTDFEKIDSNVNLSKIQPISLESPKSCNDYYRKDIQLSSYECSVLKGINGNPFGTVHVVREGNFTNEQLDLFKYCVENAGTLFENALLLKKKMFYETRIRRAFSRFVPEQMIDELASNDLQEKVSVGEKRDVAILFSDIRSFTSISEKNKPEVIVGFLNRYFTIMVNIIKKHGGTIDKFIGDAIMAEFGTPVSYDDNSRRAVAAAYEMRQALETVPLEDLILPDGMKFNIGIGVHYGDVIAGSLGSSDKTDLTVIGDSVNLASRMEGLTKTYGCQVLVTQSVKEDIERLPPEPDKEPFYFRYVDDVKVKGKKIAVPIYAVDRSENEFPPAYRDAYSKGFELYKQGIWNLAKDYFEKALSQVPEEKSAKLMLERCIEFIANPPENWDGAIAFNTK